METFSVLLAICTRNSQVTGDFPAQRPVTPSFDVFFDLLICAWINGWVNNREAGDLRRHRSQCDVTVMQHAILIHANSSGNTVQTTVDSAKIKRIKGINTLSHKKDIQIPKGTLFQWIAFPNQICRSVNLHNWRYIQNRVYQWSNIRGSIAEISKYLIFCVTIAVMWSFESPTTRFFVQNLFRLTTNHHRHSIWLAFCVGWWLPSQRSSNAERVSRSSQHIAEEPWEVYTKMCMIYITIAKIPDHDLV